MKIGKNFAIVFLILVLIFISSVSALTASIGNARMILKKINDEPIQVGDKIEKYVKVINNNNVSVNIELFASGDLAEYTKIKDDKFTLKPGEDKKAYFTIDVKKPGTTETRVNVQFSPIEGGNGVGLSSTIIIIAEDKEGFFDNLFDNQENSENNEENQNPENLGGVNVATGGKVIVKKDSEKRKTIAIALSITAIIFIIFIIVLIIAAQKKIISQKKQFNRGQKKGISKPKTKSQKRVKKK